MAEEMTFERMKVVQKSINLYRIEDSPLVDYNAVIINNPKVKQFMKEHEEIAQKVKEFKDKWKEVYGQ